MREASEQRAYTKQEVMELLGIGSSTYHKIVKHGRLQSSRLIPGGPRRHTPKQLADYFQYLDSAAVVGVDSPESEFEKRRQNSVRRG